MQIKTKHLLTALVVAGISAVAFPANAATIYSPGDLLLGFRATSGTGSTSSLVVNLGAATALRDNTGSSTLIDISSALDTTYGTGWETRSDLTWGFAGVRSNTTPTFDSTVVGGDPAQALYLSRPNTTGGIGIQGSGNLTTGGSTNHTSASGDAAAFGQSFATFAGTTFNGGLAAALDTATGSTWEDFTATSSDFRTNTSVEGVVGDAQGRILDLYRILGTNTGANPTNPSLRVGAWEGTISLGTNGVVSFDATAAPIPEPSRSVFAAMGLAALVLRRRRRA